MTPRTLHLTSTPLGPPLTVFPNDMIHYLTKRKEIDIENIGYIRTLRRKSKVLYGMRLVKAAMKGIFG